jgi:hypothetical protein
MGIRNVGVLISAGLVLTGTSFGSGAASLSLPADDPAQRRVIVIGGSRVRISAEGYAGGAHVLGVIQSWSEKFSSVCRLRLQVWSEADPDQAEADIDEYYDPLPLSARRASVLSLCRGEELPLPPGKYIISVGLEKNGDICAQGSAEVVVPR